jgi:hypothetical protein
MLTKKIGIAMCNPPVLMLTKEIGIAICHPFYYSSKEGRALSGWELNRAIKLAKAKGIACSESPFSLTEYGESLFKLLQ